MPKVKRNKEPEVRNQIEYFVRENEEGQFV